MFRQGRSVAYSILAATALVTPIVLAFKDGAEPLRTGGLQSNAANCTECHTFNRGRGSVELIGPSRRYVPGALYDLSVHVTDDDQLGAGFEVSAEAGIAPVGTFSIIDAVRTRFSGEGGSNPNFVTHTHDGLLDSAANWSTNGNAVDYSVRWEAPAGDDELIHLYATAIGMNNNEEPTGDNYYATYAALHRAEPYDADGDTDTDLADAAALQRCFGIALSGSNDVCAFVDNGDDVVEWDDWSAMATLLDGPTAEHPAGYVLADGVRGGLMYDRWWRIIGASTPQGNHPLYPETGVQSGSTTFRCKECHGWDYKGVDGAYGAGSHFTGIAGIFGTDKSPIELFKLLTADPLETPNGHDMKTYGMSDQDVWDVVKFCLEGVIDTDELIDNTDAFVGFDLFGSILYGSACLSCHGEDGTALNFGSDENPEYIGGLSRENPWEVLHKIRFGQPGTPMRGAELLEWSAEIYANVGAFCQTLP